MVCLLVCRFTSDHELHVPEPAAMNGGRCVGPKDRLLQGNLVSLQAFDSDMLRLVGANKYWLQRCTGNKQYGAGMPAARKVATRTAETVGDSGSASYQQAQSIVAGARTLKDALEAGNFLGPMSDDEKREVGAVLDALPQDVDQEFMASLLDALNNNANIAFKWAEHPERGFDHSASRRPDGTVELTLRTPSGDTLA